MKSKLTVLSLILIAISFVVAIFFIKEASIRPLTQLENILFQVIALSLGLLGSFIFGRQSAKQVAREIIKPHARSAFRRLLSLFNSLSRLAFTIENAKLSNNDLTKENNNAVLDKLEAIVTEQIATADDALEDWRDIIPDDVDEISKKVKGQIKGEDK